MSRISPVSSDTARIPPTKFGVKTMVLGFTHVRPRATRSASHTPIGAPPSTLTRRSCPFAMNAIQRPSGENVNWSASSVPLRRIVSILSSGRTRMPARVR